MPRATPEPIVVLSGNLARFTGSPTTYNLRGENHMGMQLTAMLEDVTMAEGMTLLMRAVQTGDSPRIVIYVVPPG